MRHKLFLDSPTQVGKNRITLPSALADYYGNTAQAYLNGRQVLSKTELDGTDYKTTFVTPTPTREIEIGRGNLELTDVKPDTENVNVASFDGTDRITGTSAFSEITGNGTYSIELYFKSDTVDSSQRVLIGNTNSSSDIFGIERYSSKLRMCHYYSGSYIGQRYATISASVWYHLAYTYNNGTARLFINGVEKTASDYPVTESTLGFSIGSHTGGGYKFRGDISDIRIWDKVLTPSELNQAIDGTENNLIAWYPLNGDVNDHSQNGYDGTNNGADLTATWDSKPIPIKTPSVLHWEPSSEVGYYWVLAEDASGNTVYVKVSGVWKEGTLYLKTGGSWVQADDVNVKSSGTWK